MSKFKFQKSKITVKNKMKIKKGDTVYIRSGKDKGKQGKVLSVLPERRCVIVEKINIIKKHTKPNPKMQQGGILEKPAPLNISKVMLVTPGKNKPTRVGKKLLKDGTWVRYSRKYEEVLDK